MPIQLCDGDYFKRHDQMLLRVYIDIRYMRSTLVYLADF